MNGEVLHLERDWTVGDRLDGGAFGQVYVVTSEEGQQGAAKFVPKAPGAQREMLFVALGSAPNVVPVIDHGEHDGHYVLVMPRAERSLRSLLKAEPVPSLERTVAILVDVAEALAGLDGKVVHRDLKPENVLLLDGKWCLADFGISRYAEATTADVTHKFAMTYAYAGPERWRGEHTEPSTDIYSFGVMAFEMLMGARPFLGPAQGDYRQQHLHDDSPQVTTGPVPLHSLIAECLFKPADARPTAANVLKRLQKVESSPAVGALAALQKANHTQATLYAEHSRRESANRTEAERNAALFKAGEMALGLICKEFAEAIREHAPLAQVTQVNNSLKVGLGWGGLTITTPGRTQADSLSGSSPIKVLGASTISVVCSDHVAGYAGRSHSLWFCDAVTEGEFLWYETAFMHHPLMQNAIEEVDPFDIAPGLHAGGAIRTGMNPFQLAWPFTPLRPGDIDEFLERWIGLFADASTRDLHRPSALPERQTTGSYRR